MRRARSCNSLKFKGMEEWESWAEACRPPCSKGQLEDIRARQRAATLARLRTLDGGGGGETERNPPMRLN